MGGIGRVTKQTIIAGIFLLIVGVIFFSIFRSLKPVKPTPTPDPTKDLKSIEIIIQKLLNVGNNDYDFVAKVKNPNSSFGSGSVQYQLSFYGVSGDQIVQTKTGSFYILPGQVKYFIETPIKTNLPISRAELVIKSVDWQRLDTLAENGINLVSKNVSFSYVSQPGLFAKASGNVFNSSDFDFDKVDGVVVLLNDSGDMVAVNKTDIRTFLSKTERGFEVSWFSSFVGSVKITEAEFNTNVFSNSNFLLRYGRQERFQQQF